MWKFSLKTRICLHIWKTHLLSFQILFLCHILYSFPLELLWIMLEPQLIICVSHQHLLILYLFSSHAVFWINFSALCSSSPILFSIFSNLEDHQHTDFFHWLHFPLAFFLTHLFFSDICQFLFHNFLFFMEISFISLRILNVFIVTYFAVSFVFISPQVNLSPDLDCQLSFFILLSLPSYLHV